MLFPLHLLAYAVNILSSMLSTRPHKLVEVSPAPVSKPLLQQTLFLLQLLLAKRLSCVYPLLLRLLPLLWVLNIKVQRNMVVDRLSTQKERERENESFGGG